MLLLCPLVGAQRRQEPAEGQAEVNDQLQGRVIHHLGQRGADRLRGRHGALAHRLHAVATRQRQQLTDLLEQGALVTQPGAISRHSARHRPIGPAGESGGLSGHPHLHPVRHAVVAVAGVEALGDTAHEASHDVIGVHDGIPGRELQIPPGRCPAQ